MTIKQEVRQAFEIWEMVTQLSSMLVTRYFEDFQELIERRTTMEASHTIKDRDDIRS